MNGPDAGAGADVENGKPIGIDRREEQTVRKGAVVDMADYIKAIMLFNTIGRTCLVTVVAPPIFPSVVYDAAHLEPWQVDLDF